MSDNILSTLHILMHVTLTIILWCPHSTAEETEAWEVEAARAVNGAAGL